ncbi:acid phosphatase 1-like [Neltuma alba]|uniref:acid phosphatase 1-like n=1 Tax=Neltuma alba TaxID=207710 RepID=UPI0010A34928|nr:acid phosphatase 1-like [Prosopis alba]
MKIGKVGNHCWKEEEEEEEEGYCLSWRMAVEMNNAGPWRRVPERCYRHVERYMMDGQYRRDVEMIKEQILEYVKGIEVRAGGKDGWVMDVDDTCISNLAYYKDHAFGCEAFDSAQFKQWITKAQCEAIQPMLLLFRQLLGRGFKVFLITGRDHARMAHITSLNLQRQGFIGYHRLLCRGEEHKGESAAKYKSEMRRKIEGEGYKIWGNVGDQWSDLQGCSAGHRTFKLPNPMYCIP